MNSKIVLSVLLTCGLSISANAANAADDAADRALLKQCESAKGEVKKECRDVAKEMIREDQPATERDDKTSQDVTHSSPAMTSPEEAKREAAKKPRRGQKQDAAPAEPAAPDPAK